MTKLIIEVRGNEYSGRDPNPHVPWTAEEIARDAKACRDAGASSYHFHVRGPNGRPEFSYEAHCEVIARMRALSDILIHPTLGANFTTSDPKERLANVVRLTQDGLKPDFVPIDVASSNVDHIDPQTHRFLTGDKLYVNTISTLTYFAETLRKLGIKPCAQTPTVPGLRAALAFVRSGVLDEPLFIQFNLSEGKALYGHPGTLAGLEAFLAFLPQDLRIEWGVQVFSGSLLPLAETIIRRRGHICLGLGDYHYKEAGLPTNAQLVAKVAALARSCGREVATPAETTAILGGRVLAKAV